MSQHNNLALKFLIGVFFPFFLGPILWAQPAWPVTARVDVIHSLDQYPVGGSYPVLFRISISSPWYIHGTRESGDGIIPTVLTFHDSPGIKLREIQFPSPAHKKFEYTREEVEVFSGEILVRTKLVVNKEAPAGKNVIRGRLSYQACSSRLCLPPEDVPILISLSVAHQGTKAEPRNREIFDSGIIESVPGWRLGSGLWLTLLGLFVGGLLLNLTPCIYPLIPITVSYFGGMTEKIRGKTFVHGLLYISGIAFTNSLLGLTASLSGGMLGSVLQNPIALIMVAGILVLLGLSFFGLWELQMPSGIARLASRNFGGYFGTFFMGLTLGLVAAPCLGPFVLGLLTYVGQKGDPFLGFLYFFVLSIGLGLPLSVLAIFTGTLKNLPKSGEWMVWVRKVFGWVLVGMACYLLQPLIPGSIGKAVPLAAILFAAGLHLGWLEKSKGTLRMFPYLKRGLGIILIAGAVILAIQASRSEKGLQWIPYDPAILIEAAKERRPVILDFYADWCGPCKELEKKVFRDPEVVEASQDLVPVRVDLTKQHPHQKDLLSDYQIRGVPTIIFINRQGVEEKALRVESLVGRGEVIERMKRLLEK